MSVVAKTWRKRVVITLSAIVILDFLFRMMFISDELADKAGQKEASTTVASGTMATIEQAQLVELLSWSDVEPEKTPEPQKVAVAQTVSKPPPPPSKPQVNVHQQVADAIKGDKSKYLIKDELLTLKGVFYDGREFAVVEVENIVTKKKEYFRSNANKALGKHKLSLIHI